MNYVATTRREVAFVALALALLVLLVLWVTNGAILFTRPFWVDEIHTVLVASRGSPLLVIADLRAGADFGPPLLHLATWVVGWVAGDLRPVVLRLLSLVCVLGALLLVYAVLGRRFGRDASLAGMLAVGSSSLVIAHAFEARYYGPWLLAASAFAWALPSTGVEPPRKRATWLMITSVALCLVHWYGVISMSVMCVAAVMTYRRDWRRGVRDVAPALAGVVALLVCLPLALGQRRALPAGTWVPDLSWGQFEAFARLFWDGAMLRIAAAVALLTVIVAVRRRQGRAVAASSGSILTEPALASLLALTVMPLVLVALSAVGPPSMIVRYAIVATLAWGPAVALVAEAAGSWPARILALAAAALWYPAVAQQATDKRRFEAEVSRDVAAFEQAQRLGPPVVFQSMHTMYAVAWASAERRGQLSYVELPDELIERLFGPGARFRQLNKGVAIERDVVRVHAQRFGFPHLVPHAALDTLPRFVLVTSGGTLPRGYFSAESLVAALFPNHFARPVSAEITLLERQNR